MATPGIKAFVGTSYKDAKGVQAFVSGSWKPAKSVRVYRGSSWVPALFTAVTATQDSASVVTGATVTYTATPTIPSVVAAYEWWYQHPGASVFTKWSPTTASMTWNTTGYAGSGTTMWKCVIVQHDGTRVESNILSTAVQGRSTVSLSGPKYVMSQGSGGSGSFRAPAVFTVNVGTPSVVKKVSLQLSYQSTTAWNEYKAWTAVAAEQTFSQEFTPVGDWYVRAVLTHVDDVEVVTANHYVACMSYTITCTAVPADPEVGGKTTLTASMDPACPTDWVNSPKGWQYSREGGAWTWWTDVPNPYDWPPGDTAVHDFRWQEQFPDGSTIIAAPVKVSPKPKPAPVVTALYGYGGNCADLQTLLHRAYNEGRAATGSPYPLILTGGWSGSGVPGGSGGGSCRIPAGSRVSCDANTSFSGIQMFNHNSTAYGAAGDGGYNRAGNIIWTGGSFDVYNLRSTAFSISHCPSFTLDGATIWNTITKGHGIEINSSGGPAYGGGIGSMGEADFKIKVLNCSFNGMDQAPRANGYDEAVHFDYAWIKNPGSADPDGATAAGVVNDGTVCHNILVRGNTFRRSRIYNYPTSVGMHKFTMSPDSGEHVPVDVHSHLRIESNTFAGTGQVNRDSDADQRGCVNLFAFREVWILWNNFDTVTRGVSYSTYANLPRSVGEIYVYQNTFRANSHWMVPGSGSWTSISVPWVDTNGGANGGRASGFYITENLFCGYVGAAQATYLIRCDRIDTLHVNSNKFWGLAGNATYSKQTGNRIHGDEGSPSGSVTSYQCRSNTWSASENGAGAVTANS